MSSGTTDPSLRVGAAPAPPTWLTLSDAPLPTVGRARRATVSTGRANLPARTLYRGLGFQQLNDTEVVPGLWVTHLARIP